MPTKKDKEFEKFIKELEDQQEGFTSSPGYVLTLMDVPNRADLPVRTNVGAPCLLETIINKTPEVYAQYMQFLKMGAYYNTAAEAVGIPESTVSEWGKTGKKDYYEGVDTYYSRFYSDVRRNVAQCRVIREQAIAVVDPKRWLNLGPGRIFGTQWGENIRDPEKHERKLKELEAPFSEKQQIVLEDKTSTGTKTMVVELDSKSEEETLAVLREALKMIRNDKEIDDDVVSEQ